MNNDPEESMEVFIDSKLRYCTNVNGEWRPLAVTVAEAMILKAPLPNGYEVVPLNGDGGDLRANNLRILADGELPFIEDYFRTFELLPEKTPEQQHIAEHVFGELKRLVNALHEQNVKKINALNYLKAHPQLVQEAVQNATPDPWANQVKVDYPMADWVTKGVVGEIV